MNEIILCIDDEADLLELIELNLNATLKSQGYEVIGCLNTDMAYRFIQKEHIALILMDRNLVTSDGLDFVKELKNSGYSIPIIFLSAMSMLNHRISGLQYADDYITKPFSFEEVAARIQSVLRRYKKGEENKPILKYKNITLDLKAREVSIENINIQLSPLETRIIKCFMQEAGKILTRDFLLKHAWDKDSDYRENSVNVAIKRLRKKIEKESKDIKIKSIRGKGYKLC